MSQNLFRERLLASTRGRVLALLRQSDLTVNELAEQVGLTDNAVRNHLAALERDGLIEQRGVRRSVGKPAYVYGLTSAGEALFPKVYSAVLTQVLAVVRDRGGEAAVTEIMEEVAARVAGLAGIDQEQPAAARLEASLAFIEQLAGPVATHVAPGGVTIRGYGCPLADVTAEDPAACHLVETLVRDLTDLPVSQCCEREPRPRCGFRIALD